MSNENETPRVLASKKIFHEYLSIYKDELLLKNTLVYPYYRLELKPAVMVLAVTPDHDFIINKEYRHPTNQVLLSCPGGTLNDNETPLDCAKRELLEESGYNAENFKLLSCAYPFPGITNQKVFFVFAQNATKIQKPVLETAEIIATCLKRKEDLLHEIKMGAPIDGLLCTMLFLYELHVEHV